MEETICAAHMHPLPCPGSGCWTTTDPTTVEVMKEYRADVEAGRRPPWIWELRRALAAGRAWLRSQAGDEDHAHASLARVEANIADLRRAGWTGEDDIIWKAAQGMARFTGAMPWFPQRACEDAEVRYWRRSRDGSDG